MKKTKSNEKHQSARFIEAAKKIGADESGKKFEKAVRTMLKKKEPSKSSKPPEH